MCSIFGSDDKAKFFQLAKLNSYRGTHSYSITVLKADSIIFMHKGSGPLMEVDLPEGDLYIGHQQAPTTAVKDDTSIHPASIDVAHLWHNGIIKSHVMKEWQLKYRQDWSWDTKWLLYHLINHTEDLDNIDGSFACLFYNSGRLELFRNDNYPMYIDGISFSSTKFEDSLAIDSGTIYNYQDFSWHKTTNTFKTKNPFFWTAE